MSEEPLVDFQEKMRQQYGPMYYDRKGKEMDVTSWAKKCNDLDYKIVKQESVGKYFISTVWIGLNMKLFRGQPIEIFETMIFLQSQDEAEKNASDLHLYQDRYATETEAFAGHEKAVAYAKAQSHSGQ